MKIYHTETQEDYDALMAELKLEGCTWGNREIPIKGIRWEIRRDVTCVHVSESKIMTVAKKSFFAYHSPEIPITKYKAKVNEKMKLTKENVERIFDKFMQGGDSLTDLKGQILNLSETPEKVVVPKFVANYLEDCKNRNIKLASALCPFKMGYGKEIELWFDNEDNNRLFALAWINGYEVEKEPLYEVLLPYVMWSGKRSELVTDYQKLLFDKTSEETTFVHRQYVPFNNDYTCRLTESEIKEIDERYFPFAVPVNGEK